MAVADGPAAAADGKGLAGGWQRAVAEPSLAESFRSVQVQKGGSFFRKLLAFLGPGYLVAVGYMDPGNWATSLAGGAQFGYTLLAVALISNIMAILLQALCARLAIGAGRDLAQACRDAYPRWVAWPLWVLAEMAIIATDLAEVIGTAIGLQLLFGLPLAVGVVITALDVFLILWLQSRGFRWIEAFVITLLAVIAVCFAIQIALASPDWGGVLGGFIPRPEIITNPAMLYIALGIIGATVMPHNLYLHSSIVQTRAYGDTLPEKQEALKLATIDSTAALMFALTINASILILAAATFHKTGNSHVNELGQAHQLLAPLVGASIAPMLFAIALLACGLNSTVTATMAGQIVMEGFINIRLPAWLRRLITRSIAIVPAAAGDDLLRRVADREIADPQSGDPEPAIAVRDYSAGDVYGLAPENGCDGGAALADGATALIAAIIVSLNIKLLVDFVTG